MEICHAQRNATSGVRQAAQQVSCLRLRATSGASMIKATQLTCSHGFTRQTEKSQSRKTIAHVNIHRDDEELWKAVRALPPLEPFEEKKVGLAHLRPGPGYLADLHRPVRMARRPSLAPVGRARSRSSCRTRMLRSLLCRRTCRRNGWRGTRRWRDLWWHWTRWVRRIKRLVRVPLFCG